MEDSIRRLLYVVEQVEPSNQHFGIFSEFIRKGIKLYVFNLHEGVRFKDQIKVLNLEYYSLKGGEPYWKSILRLNKLVNMINPQVIHSQEFIPSFYVGFLPRKNGYRSIYHRRHNYTPFGIVQIMDQWAVMRSNKTVAVCETMKVVAQKEHPFYKRKIIGRTNAITIGLKFLPTFETEKNIINATPNKFTILILARLRVGKGHDIAIAVLKTLISAGVDAQLLVVGEGDERKNIEEMIRNEKVEKNSLLIGNIENIELAVRKSDVMLVPSEMEAFPKTPLEGMAYGCPVIAHKVGGVVESIQHGHNGFLVENGDVETIVKYVELIKNNSQLRDMLIENGKKTVESKYVVEIMAKEMIELYNEMIN